MVFISILTRLKAQIYWFHIVELIPLKGIPWLDHFKCEPENCFYINESGNNKSSECMCELPIASCLTDKFLNILMF